MPNSNTVNYSQTIECDGPVRRIDLSVELLYHGLVAGPGSGLTVRGATAVWQNTTLTPVFGQGVNTPGTTCDSGYYSGRATATVQFLSGAPEFITSSVGSQPVSLTCAPAPIPVPPPPPPPPPTPTPSPSSTPNFPPGGIGQNPGGRK